MKLFPDAGGRQSSILVTCERHACFSSALRNDLLVPRVRTANYGARGFAFSGLRLWNSFPMSVRELYDKPEQFKKALKTFLMQQQRVLLWIHIKSKVTLY